MTLPTATYRLQFRGGMTFDTAVDLVPYLKRLGVSHLYASPVFSAVSGSTHGYDVTDHNAFDSALGGREGFERLSEALREEGLGLILDIVPNHMAASLENPWWRSVVQWGGESAYARHFDIDWSRRLTLPILGRPFQDAVAEGEIRFALDAKHGAVALAYFDNLLPLHPATWGEVLGHGALADALLEAASQASPAEDREFGRRIRELLASANTSGLEARLDALSADRTLLGRIHDMQPWQLLHWKEARRDLSYRRFFEITGLVGVRVEDPAVFDDVHRLILELVRQGKVDGLRIDHVDGLADPRAYLERLRSEVGDGTTTLVEKILEREERLPRDWPVSGTTGYEFIDALGGLFTDPDGVEKLAKAYSGLSRSAEPEEQRREAKRLMLAYNFAGEREALAGKAAALAAEPGVQAGRDELDTALTELIVSFPVYRTYGNAEGMPASDATLLHRVAAEARSAAGVDSAALDLLVAILTGEVPPDHAAAAADIRIRLQQLSGPVMAKAVEDTFFFRHNAFLALNEVGGDPLRSEGSVDAFHRAMEERAHVQPYGLSATATHDTKRGEDARARLYALSEAPQPWAEAVARWRAMHADAVSQLPGGPAPEPETEWMIYQALAGIWPTEPAGRELTQLRDRLLAFVEKAVREAKLRTSWTEADEAYEAAVKAYVERLLSPANAAFQGDFAAVLRPIAAAGLVNGIAQTLLKLTGPGVPDIYQGCERLDFSLTDPDNRRPVDFASLAEGLSQECPLPVTGEALVSGLFKQHLIARCLQVRRRSPQLFARGEYVPLSTEGARSEHALAFMRRHDGQSAVVIVPRLVLGMPAEGDAAPYAQAWGDTAVLLPAHYEGAEFRDAVTDERLQLRRRLPLSSALRNAPVALLLPDTATMA